MPAEGAIETLRHAWNALEPLGAPMAVIGGMAMSAWNHLRYTRDVDFLVQAEGAKVDELIATVGAAGFKPKRWPPILQIDDQQIVQFDFLPPEGLLPFRLDILIAGSPYQQEALSRRVKKDLPWLDRPVEVLRPEDLVLLKLYAGRVIDRADAAMLLRENRDAIDFEYLKGWVHRQKLDAEYAEIWDEAFPGEPLPPASEAAL
jgi:hypothetical protein